MTKVALIFRTDKELRRFSEILTCSYVELIPSSLKLYCNCTEEEIENAIKGFRAKIIEE